MGLEGEPEVVLVLAKHTNQLLVVARQSVRYVVKCLFHIGDISLQSLDHWVRASAPIAELNFHVLDERFKNYERQGRKG